MGQTGRIGVIATGSPLHGPTAMLAELITAIRAEGADEVVLFADTATTVQAAVDRLAATGVDALVISQPATSANAIAVPSRLPTLTLTDVANPRLLVISVDQRAGGRLATRHLLDLGHATVHHISGPVESQHTPQRTRGWRDALVGAQVTPPGAATGGDWGAAAGRTAMARLLAAQPRVTAVFVANDQMAIGAIRAVHDAGLRVPADVSVVGFDDIPEAAHLLPALTTVRQDIPAAAGHAVGTLVAAVRGRFPATRRQFLPVELMVRESSGPPPDRPR